MLELIALAGLLIAGLAVASVIGVVFLVFKVVFWAVFLPFRLLLKLLWLPIGLAMGAVSLAAGAAILRFFLSSVSPSPFLAQSPHCSHFWCRPFHSFCSA